MSRAGSLVVLAIFVLCVHGCAAALNHRRFRLENVVMKLLQSANNTNATVCPSPNGQVCSNHGVCNVTTKECHCGADAKTGFWGGANCSDCAYGYFGPSCTSVCNCPNGGICLSTRLNNTQSCGCPVGKGGASCNLTCPANDNGLCGGFAAGFCTPSSTAVGCTCKTGFAVDSTGNCMAPGATLPPAPAAAQVDMTVLGTIDTFNRTATSAVIAEICNVTANTISLVVTAGSVKVAVSIASSTGAPNVAALNRLVDATRDPNTAAIVARRLNLDPTAALPTLKTTAKPAPNPPLKVSGASQVVLSVAAIVAVLLAAL